ncbi:uncharacterized protein DFL_000615 [Arthrobotrys flagrans]|uniref:Amine oxidase domain-containing protein n=1 Tax=Arthrobotrys flagrans TaxID=97331 RepID=A0A437AET7_ARTFL|nr:hypothetical protein DFL_000615 [Arthrobotrys flagrans]
MSDPVAVVPDHAPFTEAALDKKLGLSPKKYWRWLTNLDWENIRHAPPERDVRQEFADTLIYHEVLRELDAFIEKDRQNFDAIVEAINKAFGKPISPEWIHDFDQWYKKHKRVLENPDRTSKPEMVKILGSMPIPDLKEIEKTYGEVKVGIVGGGISGLYAGRLFDWVNEYLEKNPKIGEDNMKPLRFSFEILEAANRVGGRIYTHHFSPSRHDYYDVGAMRTFDLFADVGLYRTEQLTQQANEAAKDNATQEQPKISNCGDHDHSDSPKQLLRYFMKSDRTPNYFNDIQHYRVPHGEETAAQKAKRLETEQQEKEKDKNKLEPYKEIKAKVDAARENPHGKHGKSADTYRISTKNYGDVPYAYVELGAETLLKYAYDPFKYLMRYNFYVGYQALMRYEGYSVREFLSKICKFDFYTINWLETSDSATGWFDLAFTEAVLESFTFSAPKVCVKSKGKDGATTEGHDHDHEISPDTNWYCIEGGTGEVIRRLNDKVSGEPEYNRVVIGMKLKRDAPDNEKMEVYLKDEGQNPRKYHSVINTTTLGCASRMDLKNVELQTGQKAAIRMLRYSASTKIGVKFTDPWWIKEPYVINEGGVAASDLYSARMCVYPSYNIHDSHNRPAVLLASYCWGQDAERVGSMIKKTSPEGEEILRDCLLRDLARLHHDPKAPAELKMSYDEVLASLRKKYITHHSYDWNHDSFVSGAFAVFGPGQYRKMMPHLQRPTADSRLHFVGEATSNHHAWIVGALESSLRAVCHLLIKTGHWDIVKDLFAAWDPLPGFNEKIFFWQYVLGLLPPSSQATGQDIDTVKEV